MDENPNVSSGNTKFCKHCGSKNAKSKWVAVNLCFFLGGLGAHKFYEGKIDLGILYLLSMGLFGIGVLIDLIILLIKPDPYYV